jgi:hypothetical protein
MEVAMPTFYDPGADAEQASEALRGLAQGNRAFDRPQDMYGVLGELLSGVRSLRQVLNQLATAHASNRSHVFDDHGDHTAESKDARAAADEVRQAATLINQAEDHLNLAMSAAGRIAWRAETATESAEVSRWIGVVFLQGEDADDVLDMIDRDGAAPAIGYLKNWDYGDETTDAALENGDVYDIPPTGPLEREIRDGDYQMTYSHSFAHVALYRLHSISSEDTLVDGSATHAGPDSPLGQSRPEPSSRWFEHPGVAAVSQARGIAL